MNQQQYEFIKQKYGNLIYKIAHHISGDVATTDIEDNEQDLWVTACDAINWFEKQDGGKNGKFEDFKNTKGFDQYIKTCLWHKKGKKGAGVTKKMKINKWVSIDGNLHDHDDHLMFDVSDPKIVNFSSSEDLLEDIRVKLQPSEKKIVTHILKHPDCVKLDGSVNVAQIIKETGLSNIVVQAALRSIRNSYNLSIN
jgi:DNA-directed RNA polymerase specialized sigma subunit